MKLKLAISPCPNDTFLFGPIINRLIDHPYELEVVYEDIRDLNLIARQGQADLCKVSFYAYTQLPGWQLLDAGAALGRGVGPLLVARQPNVDLSKAHIAIPGADTTANLLMQYYAPQAQHKTVVLFSDIMPAVARGDYDAGVIIHESRFTYAQHGLVCLQDLGQHWEDRTGLPIPLGGIVARPGLPTEVVADWEALLRRSLDYAWAQPEAVMPYVRCYAQEMDEQVMWQHIRLYVNEYTRTLGPEGQKAVAQLKAVADAANISA